MSGRTFFAGLSKHTHSSLVKSTFFGLRAGRIRIGVALPIALLCAFAGQAWAARLATTTTLTPSSKTVNGRTITVLAAKVTDPATVMQGLVRFYDGKTLLGSAQIVNTGTKYTHGAANLSVELGWGSHALKAAFAGTATDASSASSTLTVAIGGGTSATTISVTGSVGNYTLTGQVMADGMTAPTGEVSFLDQTNSDALIGTSTLAVGTPAMKFTKATTYSLYDPADYSRPQQLVVADLNGDGILDIAMVDYSTGISIYLGKGDGTFEAAKPFCTTGTPPTPCAAGSEPVSIATGDFNSDGIPDLVVQDGSNVDVMIGNGDGTFQPEVAYGTASGNYNIVVADLNLDGTPDLALTVSGGVSILLGNGDGTFQPHNDIALNDSSTYLTAGDFNKDGIPDLAVDGWNGASVMILLGVGDGTFQAEKDTPIDVNPANGTVVGADFKGTGFLCDLALSGDGTLEAMLGNGDGTFKTPQELKPNTTFDEFNGGFAVADLNGDGIPDMALTWYDSDTDVGRVGVFYGKGDGTFNPTPKTLNVGEQPIWIATGDFDGNGLLDLVTANESDSTLSVILNSATNTATTTPLTVAAPGVGTQEVFAQYKGDAGYASSESTTIPLTGSGVVRPVLTSLSPFSALAGSGAFTLTVNGSGFAAGSVVKWNGNARTTALISASKLTAAILATDIATAGSYTVTVVSGGATSNALAFTVSGSTGSSPLLTSITPNYATVGSAALTLTVNGSKFVSGAIVFWNTTKLITTFGSATKLTAAVPAADLAAPGSASITVVNPGNITSNAMTFTVSPATHTPLAFGFFNQLGTPGATSGNITCTWNTSEYLCTVTGEKFFYSKYVVNATPADTDFPAMATVNSIGGQIIVKIFNLSGTAIQDPFYISVFKP